MKIVPNNFGYVTEDIMRCTVPDERHFPFLETLELKSIVFISQGSRTPRAPLLAWASENHVTILQRYVREGISVSVCEDVVFDVLKLVLDSRQYPVLITCTTGRYRTGTVVACLRKVQMWNLHSIIEEYRRFCMGDSLKGSGRVEDEQFIELFDTDLVAVPIVSK